MLCESGVQNFGVKFSNARGISKSFHTHPRRVQWMLKAASLLPPKKTFTVVCEHMHVSHYIWSSGGGIFSGMFEINYAVPVCWAVQPVPERREGIAQKAVKIETEAAFLPFA